MVCRGRSGPLRAPIHKWTAHFASIPIVTLNAHRCSSTSIFHPPTVAGQVVDAWVVFRVPTFVIVLAAEIVMVVGGAGAGCVLWAQRQTSRRVTCPCCHIRVRGGVVRQNSGCSALAIDETRYACLQSLHDPKKEWRGQQVCFAVCTPMQLAINCGALVCLCPLSRCMSVGLFTPLVQTTVILLCALATARPLDDFG